MFNLNVAALYKGAIEENHTTEHQNCQPNNRFLSLVA